MDREWKIEEAEEIIKKYRIREAEEVIQGCIGSNGIWASPGLTEYRYQYFTRDFAIGGLYGLLKVGHQDVARKHLSNLAQHQHDDGHISIILYDEPYKILFQKVVRLMKDPSRIRKIGNHLPLLAGQSSTDNLTPHTTDSELHYIDAFRTYEILTGDTTLSEEHPDSIERALAFAETNIRDGLFRGGDWRDNVRFLKKTEKWNNNVREPEDVTLLSNNALLYHVYNLMGLKDKAKPLRDEIIKSFWKGEYYTDHPETDSFDTLGQALAVRWGIAEEGQYPSVIKQFEKMLTPYGFRANDLAMPECIGEEKKTNERVNQYGTIWPHAMGNAIIALEKMGAHELVLEGFNRWNQLKGFREWYNPLTGEGGGAQRQMWSAALYLNVERRLCSLGRS
ncbi:hypothetical protein HY638_05990 [Candidatus Woesearchaeota archaeon]|nr:hypothetical protein [Candidatus Woesearchaeota archaeon]